jgi:hypothetical protein
VVWPLFEAAVTDEVLVKLGERLEVANRIAPTRPHPDTAPTPAVLKTVGMVTATLDHVRDAWSGRAADNPPDPQSN